MQISRGVRGATMIAMLYVTLCGCSPAPEEPTSAEPVRTGEYDFSSDWFSDRIPVWEEVLAGYTGKPDLQYLEIGTFEGRSFFWMLDNILTDPSCRATGIDVFPLDLRQRFDANLAASGQVQRVTTIAGTSQVALRTLPLDSYDIIYVDGSHAAKDVLADAVLCWPLLKSGGLLILDDYSWQLDWPLEFRPQVSIDAFLTVYRNDLEVVHRGDQMMVRKVEMPMPYVLRLGNHAYFWRQQELYRIGEQTPRTPSEAEQVAIGRLAMSRGFGQVEWTAPPEVLAKPQVRQLVDELSLEIETVD